MSPVECVSLNPCPKIMDYLDFEAPIRELDEQIAKAHALQAESGVDMKDSLVELEAKLAEAQAELKASLSPWQRVQLSRHTGRPYTMAYIEAMTGGEFIEMHGDRHVKDDKAMVGGWGAIEGESFPSSVSRKASTPKCGSYAILEWPTPKVIARRFV